MAYSKQQNLGRIFFFNVKKQEGHGSSGNNNAHQRNKDRG